MAAHWEAGGSQGLRAREPISERKMGSWRQAALRNQQETSRVVFGVVIVLFSASRRELTIPCQTGVWYGVLTGDATVLWPETQPSCALYLAG